MPEALIESHNLINCPFLLNLFIWISFWVMFIFLWKLTWEKVTHHSLFYICKVLPQPTSISGYPFPFFRLRNENGSPVNIPPPPNWLSLFLHSSGRPIFRNLRTLKTSLLEERCNGRGGRVEGDGCLYTSLSWGEVFRL